ncbi:MAG: septal ring lytic transglycosylase RlpA family protein [Patescibacteria group bacterium]|jgi:hypothetical protein
MQTATIITSTKLIRQFIVGAFMVIGISVIIRPVQAAEIVQQVYLDQPTITKGYTVVTPDTNLRVGIVSGVVMEPVTVTVKSITQEEIVPPEGFTLVSHVYEYDLIGQTNPLILSKPYRLAMKYTSDNRREKSLYYWNKLTAAWVKLPSQTNWEANEVRAASPLPYSLIAVFEAQASVRQPLILSVSSTSDVTAAFDDGSAKAVLPKGAVVNTAVLTLKDSDVSPIQNGLRLVSPSYIFDITGTTQTKLNQLLTLTIKYDTDTIYRRNIYYWDRNANSWRLLPSTVDYDAHTVTARTTLKYALVGVLETDEPVVQEGKATWYPSKKYPHGAASNVFPYNTRLKVTNLDNNKSTVVTVKSTGAFKLPCVIDLVKTAFSEVANTGQGIIHRVRVEKI